MRGIVSVLAAAVLAVAFAGCASVRHQGSDLPIGGSGITGFVFQKEGAAGLAGAFIYAYREKGSSMLLGPSDYISGETNEDGSYVLPMSAGTYYVVARKRLSGENTGPLSPGDLYSDHSMTGITVREGKFETVNFVMVNRDEPMFFKLNRERQATTTGVKGVIVDEAGKPVPGAFALAYSTPDLKRLPEFASTVTTSDGKFTLYLPKGGKYYLAGRTSSKERPRKGEYYGVYNGSPDHSVEIRDSSFVGEVKITVAPFAGTLNRSKPY